MVDYTIYCTPEQTKWSIKLGAQPKIIDSQERVDKNIERIRDTYGIHSYEYKNATYYLVELRYKNSLRVVVVDKVVYNLPTAEQMCGWLEKQVLSIEQMKELIALGLDVSKASMVWYSKNGVHLSTSKDFLEYYQGLFEEIEVIPTFTFYDIVHKILPHVIFNDDLIPFELTIKKCGIYYRNNDGNDLIGIVQRPDEETLIDCAYYVLKNMLENKLISNSNK